MTDLTRIPEWSTTQGRHRSRARGVADAALSVGDLSFSPYLAATNGDTSVIDLIGPIVVGEGCLIITGYQDFLSALSIIMEVRPGITHEPPSSIRILFGTNTDNLRYHAGPRQPLPEHVRRHFMSQTGVFARDIRDLGAIKALQAIRSGAIEVRVFDETRAEADLGRFPGMMHANLFINDEMAVAGSANFSRRGMASNIEFNDRVLAGAARDGCECPHEARRRAGEAFWHWGRPWSDEAAEILEHLLRSVDATSALRQVLAGLRDFQPWRPISAATSQSEEDVIYAASQSVYEHGFAWAELPCGASHPLVGRAVASIVADMYERTVMRDDNGAARRQGALAMVPKIASAAWRKGRRGPVRVMPSEAKGAPMRDVIEEMDISAAVVLDRAEELVARRLDPAAEASVLSATSGGWTVGLSGSLPDGLALEAVAALLEEAGALYTSHEATAEITRALAPLAVSRSGKRTKRSASKAEEAMRSALGALSPFMCRPDFSPGQVRIAKSNIQPTDAQREALERLRTLIDEVQGNAENSPAEEARVLFEDLRRLICGVSTCMEALQVAWRDGLGDRLKKFAGGAKAGGDQGLLPMFASPGAGAGARAVEEIEEIVLGRPLRGLDRSRSEACAAVSDDPLLVVVETPLEARFVADRLAEVTDRQVVSFYQGAIGGRSQATEVVAAGETVGRAALHLDPETDPTEAIAKACDEKGILVATAEEAIRCDLRSFSCAALFASPQDMTRTYGVLDLAGALKDKTIYCIETALTSVAGGSKGAVRALRDAVVPGSSGALRSDSWQASSLLQTVLEDRSRASSTSGNLTDRVSALATKIAASEAAGDRLPKVSWGADYAVLSGAGEAFTAFFLAGKSGRRKDIFMPPRLVVIRHTSDGDEVIQNQVAAFDMIARAYERTQKSGDPCAAQAISPKELETIGGHLAEITHWDIRPERVSVLAKSLSEFLEGRLLECDGETILGDLTLPSLELLCERWASHLGPAWRAEKVASRDHWHKRGQVDDPVDLRRIESALASRPSWEVEAVRAEMRELAEDLFFADRDRTKTVQDRVSVIIRADP